MKDTKKIQGHLDKALMKDTKKIQAHIDKALHSLEIAKDAASKAIDLVWAKSHPMETPGILGRTRHSTKAVKQVKAALTKGYRQTITAQEATKDTIQMLEKHLDHILWNAEIQRTIETRQINLRYDVPGYVREAIREAKGAAKAETVAKKESRAATRKEDAARAEAAQPRHSNREAAQKRAELAMEQEFAASVAAMDAKMDAVEAEERKIATMRKWLDC